MKCIKFKPIWAWGSGEQQYIFFDFSSTKLTKEEESELATYIEEKFNVNVESDKYRGIDYEFCEPPAEALDEEIRKTESQIKGFQYHLEQIKRLKESK